MTDLEKLALDLVNELADLTVRRCVEGKNSISFMEWKDRSKQIVMDALLKAQQPPAGWQLVPKEPTETMARAALCGWAGVPSDHELSKYQNLSLEAWQKAMKATIVAAPQPP
jgi:hypothetical protein